MIQVTNKYKHATGDVTIYIGRGSPLGNPFVMDPSKGVTRDVVIAKYAEWLDQQIKSYNLKVCEALDRIVDASKEYGVVSLQCFCAPQKCHGDIIKAVVEKHIQESEK